MFRDAKLETPRKGKVRYVRDMDEIYRLHASSVYRFLCSITTDPNLAEELTQETFYQATKSIHRYNGRCKLFVWLCQIGKHLYFDHLKREKRFQRSVNWERLEQEPATRIFDLPEEALALKERLGALDHQIKNLSKDQQEVVLLRANAGLSFREIGDLLGQTENWARVTFYRAKTKLREGDDDA